MGDATWTNYAGNQKVEPKQLETPERLEAVQTIVRDATTQGSQVRAVATGLSFSDILQTTETLVDATRLTAEGHPDGILPNQHELWKDPHPGEARVRIAAGARIRTLNAALASAGLGFKNLGGFDYQTIVGATSTSTHGSGLSLPPFPDLIRSLQLVTTGGRVLQIEPADGITDAAKFAARHGNDMTLVQDDDHFWAAVVSLGCMGVIYSMTMAVMPAYLLSERRVVTSWASVKQRLAAGMLDQHRHVEVVINPFSGLCLLTWRDIAPMGSKRTPVPALRELSEHIMFSKGGQKALLDFLNHNPKGTPGLIDGGLRAMINTRPRVSDSYLIYNVGAINDAKVISAEYAFSMQGDDHIGGVDALIDVIRANAAAGEGYQPSPIALRFVRRSEALLSMMNGCDTCTVETPVFSGLPNAEAMIRSYETVAIEHGARPHWGQINEQTGVDDWLHRAYPTADRWLAVYRALNDRGVFNNAFTERLGISVTPPAATDAIASEAEAQAAPGAASSHGSAATAGGTP